MTALFPPNPQAWSCHGSDVQNDCCSGRYSNLAQYACVFYKKDAISGSRRQLAISTLQRAFHRKNHKLRILRKANHVTRIFEQPPKWNERQAGRQKSTHATIATPANKAKYASVLGVAWP